jgi:phage N-6-adenine-methyltransferase
VSYVARNHPQQLAARGALDDVDDRRTPLVLLAECMSLAAVEAFDLDAAATAESTIAPRYYTREDNGLLLPWFGRVWVNPPYSDLGSWVAKAERESRRCECVVMLLPANRTEQAWWQDIVEPARLVGYPLTVWFLRGRRRFDRPGWTVPTKGDRPPFGLALLRWSR